MRFLLAAMLFVGATLAGCAGDGEADPGTGPIQGTAKGVVQGLLVDDRFRPIELTETRATTDFQAQGFILVQETGDQVRTTSNGEFSTPPLDPGTYTLRFTIAGHEATPQTATVRAGEVTEATVVARRVVSTTDVIIQQEFAVFIPCMVGAVVTPIGACALMDLSGDTARYVFRMNISGLQDLTFLVNELLLNKDAGSLMDGTYMMQIEGPNPEDGATSYNFVAKFIEDGRYDKTIVEKGVADPELQQDPILMYGTWEDEMEWIGWRFWGQGLLRKDLNDAGVPVPYGVGLQLGMKAKVLTSLFFTDDRATVEAYCVLCAPA